MEPSAILANVVVFFAGLLITMVVTPFLANKMRKKGIVGVDIHKLHRPEIPTMCGVSIIAGLIAAIAICCLLLTEYWIEFFAFLCVVLIAGLIGIIDDLKPLGARTKPVLTALASIPILLLSVYNPRPMLPIIGRVRLTIVYPFLIPFAVAVPANAVNMLDVFNGVMPGTCGIAVLTLLLSSLILGRGEAVVLCSALLGCLLAFYYYNRLPAKVFSGDSGSLPVGAAIGALAVIGRIEIVTIVALMPHIMNAFYGLASIGHLYERKEVSARPTVMLGNGQLAASDDSKSPITLARTVLAGGPMEEKDIVNAFLLLTAFSGFLAILTALLMV